MANDWILDVLQDLTTFAQKNGYDALERHLIDAANTAAVEIDAGAGLPQNVVVRGLSYAGILHRNTRAGTNA